MKRFYITGVSGTGKSTVAEKLREKGISTIDLDEIDGLCHWENKNTKEITNWYSGIGTDFFESNQYVCDKDKLITLMNKGGNVIVVFGVADNFSDLSYLFDKILLFHCDKEVFIKRIQNRTNHDFGKHQ